MLSGGIDAVAADLDRSVSTREGRAALARAAGMLTATTPDHFRLIGDETFFRFDAVSKEKRTGVMLTYEVEAPSGWRVIAVSIDKTGPRAWKVIGFFVRPANASQEVLNAFTLRGRRPMQLAILALAAATVAVTILALVQCARTRMRRKALWLVACALAVGQIAVNWTTGDVRFSVLSFQLLGSGVARIGAGPWIVSTGFPVGAVLFLVLRRRLRIVDTVGVPPAG